MPSTRVREGRKNYLYDGEGTGWRGLLVRLYGGEVEICVEVGWDEALFPFRASLGLQIGKSTGGRPSTVMGGRGRISETRRVLYYLVTLFPVRLLWMDGRLIMHVTFVCSWMDTRNSDYAI